VNFKEQVDEVEMGKIDEKAEVQVHVKAGQIIRSHEVYDNTIYIPNKSLRLLSIPMNSSLTFQKLIWFHSAYDVMYAILMIGTLFHKM
jgi:hypothetical protein